MTNYEIVKILRNRTARAIINHCVNKFGQTVYRHKGKSLTLSIDEITEFLMNDIENGIREELDEQSAWLQCIDTYSRLLSECSTGQDVDINTVSLSKLGVDVVESLFNEMITDLIKMRVI